MCKVNLQIKLVVGISATTVSGLLDNTDSGRSIQHDHWPIMGVGKQQNTLRNKSLKIWLLNRGVIQ